MSGMGELESRMNRSSGLALLVAAAWCVMLAAGVAAAQQPDANQQPVEIHSDKLEALRDEGRSIYTGNVDVVDGKSRLKADKLTVICDQPVGAAAKAKGEDANPACNIRQLVAESNVYYLLDDDKISGDRAEYDYTTGVITVTGNPVILSRGDKGVISGPKLVYDVNKGVARMSGLNAGDRITSIFVPKDEGAPAAPTQN